MFLPQVHPPSVSFNLIASTRSYLHEYSSSVQSEAGVAADRNTMLTRDEKREARIERLGAGGGGGVKGVGHEFLPHAGALLF